MSIAITGISSMATRQILGNLTRRYEEMTGFRVAIEPMGGGDAAHLIRAGEATDLIAAGAFDGGIVPKLRAAAIAAAHGVSAEIGRTEVTA
mgnify:CR=1 FL=1